MWLHGGHIRAHLRAPASAVDRLRRHSPAGGRRVPCPGRRPCVRQAPPVAATAPGHTLAIVARFPARGSPAAAAAALSTNRACLLAWWPHIYIWQRVNDSGSPPRPPSSAATLSFRCGKPRALIPLVPCVLSRSLLPVFLGCRQAGSPRHSCTKPAARNSEGSSAPANPSVEHSQGSSTRQQLWPYR